MKLWLDGQCFQSASRNRGIGRYASELIKALVDLRSKVDLSISFNAQLASEAVAARDFVSHFIPSKNIHMWNGICEGGEASTGYTDARRLSEIALTHHVNCLAPDVALSLSPFEGQSDVTSPLLPSTLLKVPCAGIFYDAIPWRYKSTYLAQGFHQQSYERRFRACGNFRKLLCISEFVTREAYDLFPKIPAINISAGVSADFLFPPDGRKHVELGFKNPFVLYVGGLDWRKNVRLIPDAFAKLKEEVRSKYCFVIAGDNPPRELGELHSHWIANGLDPEKFKYVGYVKEGELLDLYKRAALLVQPSFMEGFGLTALESLYCGTPVLAANSGALPEIITDRNSRFDPQSADELAERLEFSLENKSTAKILHRARLAAEKKFTWAKSAKKAAAALAQMKKNKASRGNSLKQLRNFSAAFLKDNSVEMLVAAPTMATAETHENCARRLIIDVSHTITSPAETGIQRVVRRICQELKAAGDKLETPPTFVYCRDKDVWRSVSSISGHVASQLTGEPLPPFHRDDKILLLDSSWEYVDAHYNGLLEARLRGAEILVSIFDLIPITHSAFCVGPIVVAYKNWFLTVLQLATGFVCISKAVADQLLQVLGWIDFPRPVKVGYWHLGADMDGASHEYVDATDSNKPNASGAINFLMVGTLEPRKGHGVALEAFEELWSQGDDSTLTIVGKRGWKVSQLEKQILGHREFGTRLFWHDNANDLELAGHYLKADALIAASYVEGFGLPIIEAGRHGKPIIASNIQVFREVAAGTASAHFFEPGSAYDLKMKILEFKSRALKSMRKARVRQPRVPNWSQSAYELYDLILQDNWYSLYKPQENYPFVQLNNIGTMANFRAYSEAERLHQLRLVSFLDPTDDMNTCEIVVSVKNHSNTVWFGSGDKDGQYMIGLSYHTFSAAGKLLAFDNPCTAIPLCIGPGDTQFMSVSVPLGSGQSRVGSVVIELVQKGVAWWGSGLHVDMPKAV